MINLINCGLTTFNFKQQVASDIGQHGQYLPAENIQSQKHLEKIENWTNENKMALNTKKSKYMVFNFTNKHQFNTRLSINDILLEEVRECRLLGLTLTNRYRICRPFLRFLDPEISPF